MRNSVSTTPEQEATLWRKVMAFLHDVGEEEEEEDSELIPEGQGVGGETPTRAEVHAAAEELAMVPTGAAYVPVATPGSRGAGPSGPPSTAGSVPVPPRSRAGGGLSHAHVKGRASPTPKKPKKTRKRSNASGNSS